MLSVVVPTWNGRDELARCLAALEAQTLSDLEIVVVDNGSTDGTVDHVRRHHPRARVVALARNTGFTGAANAGIEASRGEFVALLNNDAIAEPRWAEELLAAMDHADVAAALILRHDDPEIVDSRGEALSRWGLPYRSGRGERADALDANGYPAIFAASGGACIYRRATLDAVGRFDERYFAYLEDLDLGFRARLAGHRIVLAPRARVLHKDGATAAAMGHFRLHQLIRNSHLLIWKNLPAVSLAKTLPRFAVVQAHLLVAAARRSALPGALRAHAEVVAGFPALLAERRRVQRTRRVPRAEVEGWLTDAWPLDTDPRQVLASALRRADSARRPAARRSR
jgi:GT2 family glycosyltransferase